MASDAIVLGTAGMLGALHALEVDHMLAVTTFVSRRPTLASATNFGLRWGLGHSIAVLAAGGALLATGVHWPSRFDDWGEALVGLMLIGLGLWALASARKLHLHSVEEHGDHAHLHLHALRGPHHHPHDRELDSPARHEHGGITLVGLLHGLAGTAGVVALVPITMMERVALGLGYLAVFGLGVTLAMTVFALVAASAIRRINDRSLRWGRRLVAAIGAFGIVAGVGWMARVLGS
jgi:ABC-type nickel/cobalt efflux system permease component RcnA